VNATDVVRRVLVPAVVMAVATVACGGEGRPQAGPSASATFEDVTTISPGTREWLAVFATAEDPADLEGIQDRILGESPENVAVAPAGCWEEVPGELDLEEDWYVAGVVATSPEALQEAVEAVGREPVFEGEVTLLACD
jgi:hypothetical protein